MDKKKRNYLVMLFCIMFFIVGIGSIIGSFFIYSNTDNFIKNGILVDAKIYSIEYHGKDEDASYVCYVEYTIDGTLYQNQLDRYNSNMREGQTIQIRYLPNNPNKIAYAKNEYIGFWASLIGGIVAVLISAFSFFLFSRKTIQENEKSFQ